MTNRARGTFEVKLTPQSVTEGAEQAKIGRLSIEKRFQGDLEGASRGEMLSVMGSVKASAGYVAIERVEGTLAGRAGSFALQHHGLMDRGEGRLIVTVIPDSGTGDLEGLTGTMSIVIEGGKHSYEFEYALAGAARPA